MTCSLINSVFHFLIFTHLGQIVLILVGLFDIVFVALVLTRRTTKYIIEDLGLARHILVTWFIVPVFRIYFWLLERTDKLKIAVDAPIQWEEKRLIFVGNHAMPKLQDTFLMPVIIFFLNPGNLTNPIRYFPFTIADEANFFKTKFFQLFAGTYYLELVDRTADGKMRARSFLEEWKKRLTEISVWLIANIEGGRTQSAKAWLTSEKGSRLGTPIRGIAVLSLETNTTVVPYWGRIVNVPYRRLSPQALFWKFLERVFKKPWQEMGFYTDRPRPCPPTVFWGLMELLFNPGVKVFIDINHPAGPVSPLVGEENSRQLTARIAKTLLSLGDYQLNRIERSRKK